MDESTLLINMLIIGALRLQEIDCSWGSVMDERYKELADQVGDDAVFFRYLRKKMHPKDLDILVDYLSVKDELVAMEKLHLLLYGLFWGIAVMGDIEGDFGGSV